MLAAVITPDWNPITMLLVAGAMIGLYELSLLLARWLFSARDKASMRHEKRAG